MRIEDELKNFFPEETFRSFKIEPIEKIDSTNSELMRRAQKGAQDGLVLVADHQFKGRGRIQRSWHSVQGKDLLFSFLLKREKMIKEPTLLCLASGLYMAKAIEKLIFLKPALKWPNDIQLNGKKVGGILVESTMANHSPVYIVVGIGVNVNSQTQDFPPELLNSATSIFLETKKEIPRFKLLRLFLTIFEEGFGKLVDENNLKEFFEEYENYAKMIGSSVRVKIGDKELEGEVKDYTERGGLLLYASKEELEIDIGELTRLRRRGNASCN